MNGKFRVWDGRKYHYNAALVNGIAMIEENPQRSDKITVGGIDYYSDWAKYKPVKWANENKKGEIVVEFCTGLSASKSYRGTKPEDLEIYTGDILLLERTYGDGTHAKLTREVYWDKDECGFFVRDFPQRPMGTGICHPAKREWCERAEIIGNTHGEVQK